MDEGVEDGLHDDAIASLRRRCVRVLSLAHRSPYRRDLRRKKKDQSTEFPLKREKRTYQMVLCGFAVSDEAGWVGDQKGQEGRGTWWLTCLRLRSLGCVVLRGRP